MQFTIDRKFFVEKLNVISRSINQFAPLPILSGIKIEVFDESITLTGSDSNVSIQTKFKKNELNLLDVVSNGSIVVECKYLLEIIKKLDSSLVKIEVRENDDYGNMIVNISNDKGKFNLNGINVNEYPNIDFSKPEQEFSLKSDDFKKIVNQTAFACSENDVRPVLSGVNFKADGNELYCSATDTYRLARKKMILENNTNFNVTIPAKFLQEVSRSAKENEIITICLGVKKAQFYFDNNVFQTRLLNGSFPDVERVIPQQFISNMKVDAKEIVNAIDRTDFIRTDKVHFVKLVCDSDDVHLKTNSGEIGNSDEKLMSVEYEGSDIKLSFNGKYANEAIKALNCTKVELCFTGIMKPIKIVNPEDDSVCMVIVPIRNYE